MQSFWDSADSKLFKSCFIKRSIKKKKKKRNFHDKIIIVKLSGYTCVCLSTSFLGFFGISIPTSITHISGYKWSGSKIINSNNFKKVWILVFTKFWFTNTQLGKIKEQKIKNGYGKKVGIIDRLYQLYIDFPCFLSLVYKTDDRWECKI